MCVTGYVPWWEDFSPWGAASDGMGYIFTVGKTFVPPNFCLHRRVMILLAIHFNDALAIKSSFAILCPCNTSRPCMHACLQFGCWWLTHAWRWRCISVWQLRTSIVWLVPARGVEQEMRYSQHGNVFCSRWRHVALPWRRLTPEGGACFYRPSLLLLLRRQLACFIGASPFLKFDAIVSWCTLMVYVKYRNTWDH